jgi:hypothetical protein
MHVLKYVVLLLTELLYHTLLQVMLQCKPHALACPAGQLRCCGFGTHLRIPFVASEVPLK